MVFEDTTILENIDNFKYELKGEKEEKQSEVIFSKSDSINGLRDYYLALEATNTIDGDKGTFFAFKDLIFNEGSYKPYKPP